MKFSVRKRLSLTRPGAHGGGTLIGPYIELEKPSSVPECGWESYITEKWGSGEYWVFTFRGGRGHGFETVFKGEI